MKYTICTIILLSGCSMNNYVTYKDWENASKVCANNEGVAFAASHFDYVQVLCKNNAKFELTK